MKAELQLNDKGIWRAHADPFLHIEAEDVFCQKAYDRLFKAFGELLKGDDGQENKTFQFVKSLPTYDAQMVSLSPALAERFNPLFTRTWIDFLACLLDMPSLPQIDGGLHHIPKNSNSGWLHTDLSSAWFAYDTDIQEDVIFPDRSACDYFTGAPRKSNVHPKEFVRAATMIFYIDNDDWGEGDGGETGLYATGRSDVGPMKAVPPRSNSLILFECSPHSFHRLLANPGRVRNSVILWLHMTVERALSRWGTAVIRRRPK
jgi:hypothetical protein